MGDESLMEGPIDGITNECVIFGWVVLLVVLFAACFMRKITDSKEGAAKSIVNQWIMPGLGVWLIALFVVFVSVIFFDSATVCVKKLLDTNKKIEIIELLGWAINGTFIAIGLAVLSQRVDAQMRTAEAHADAAEAQADAAKAQADAAKAQAGATQAQVDNNILVEKGRTQERFKTAAEHLGHDNASVRISAFYEFLHLIKDDGNEYRKSILNILYAHIRSITANFANSEDVKNAEKKDERIKSTEEIQGLLDILFKSQDIDRSDIKPNLQRVYFSGADLSHGDLSGADLSKADLSEVNLSEAKMPEVNLSEAKMPGVNLSGADLSEANLSEAFLPRAHLFRANLSGADLSGAKLFGALLSRADLSGANLSGAFLPRARLFEADLSGADLSEADLSRVYLGRASYTNETQFPEWIKLPIVPPDNGNKVQFPRRFIAPEKPKDDE